MYRECHRKLSGVLTPLKSVKVLDSCASATAICATAYGRRKCMSIGCGPFSGFMVWRPGPHERRVSGGDSQSDGLAAQDLIRWAARNQQETERHGMSVELDDRFGADVRPTADGREH